MVFLLQWLQAFASWLWTGLQHLGLIVFGALMQGLGQVIADIPVPGFATDAAGYIGSIPPLAAFLLHALQIGPGITIVCTAMLVRFVIRRLPFIG
jgi:hypothetical protein